ncbi:MAG: type II toxin-antitoxin system Phd/YefM family antitoxin [Prochlorococcus sp.]|nr:type II toxin-antitoxin system prevent-host-death family antitoxin [Prochlorococcaceae cyanobacterium Fu_MAG_50]
MAVINAAEANRSFSRLLRQVAEGETFTVLCHGRPVATLSPASGAADNLPARRRLLERLTLQPIGGQARDWRREDLYD